MLNLTGATQTVLKRNEHTALCLESWKYNSYQGSHRKAVDTKEEMFSYLLTQNKKTRYKKCLGSVFVLPKDNNDNNHNNHKPNDQMYCKKIL